MRGQQQQQRDVTRWLAAAQNARLRYTATACASVSCVFVLFYTFFLASRTYTSTIYLNNLPNICLFILSHLSTSNHPLHIRTAHASCRTAFHVSELLIVHAHLPKMKTTNAHPAAGSITSNDSGHGSCAPTDHSDSTSSSLNSTGLYHVASSIVHNTPSPTLMQPQQQQLQQHQQHQQRRNSAAMHGKYTR